MELFWSPLASLFVPELALLPLNCFYHLQQIPAEILFHLSNADLEELCIRAIVKELVAEIW